MNARVVVCLVVGLLACSDSKTEDTKAPTYAGGHVSQYPSCQAIIDKCHPLDVEEGPIHDCHDLGHAASGDAECAAQKDRCFALCVEAPDSGAVDAAEGG